MDRRARRHVQFVLGMLLIGGVSGCVRRTLTIETDPQGAMVTLNDEEIGPAPVSRDFTWYGDYDVAIRKEGYATLHTHAVVRAPWYQVPPIDFFTDCLWPGEIQDHHVHRFTLDPWTPPDHDELVGRAVVLRREALSDGG